MVDSQQQQLLETAASKECLRTGLAKRQPDVEPHSPALTSLPVEVQAAILAHLCSRDLGQMANVCLGWRLMIWRNMLWVGGPLGLRLEDGDTYGAVTLQSSGRHAEAGRPGNRPYMQLLPLRERDAGDQRLESSPNGTTLERMAEVNPVVRRGGGSSRLQLVVSQFERLLALLPEMNCWKLRREPLPSGCCNFRDLHHLSLINEDSITDADIQLLDCRAGGPTLEYLYLMDMFKLTDKSLQYLCEGQPHLRVLSLISCFGVTNQGAKLLGRLPRLQHLRLYDLPYVGCETVRQLAGSTSLLKLDIWECRVSNRGLSYLVEEGDLTLTHLSVRRCWADPEFPLLLRLIRMRGLRELILSNVYLTANQEKLINVRDGLKFRLRHELKCPVQCCRPPFTFAD